ncbi:hypothetical protein [Saccharopolyspora gloriosae]|uniref:hypothetical protein n=1 Tax=Saccharopolyspora gloriosae TaxID=455344 RepID=UPI002867EF56|nr:hypothetical protein [Saccharopolyspora gloriosae]
MLGAARQQLAHLLVRTGQHHGVGRGFRVARPPAQQVRGALAARVQQPGVVVGADSVVADDPGQRGPDLVRQPRLPDAHFGPVHRRRVAAHHTESLFEQGAHLFGHGARGLGGAPGVPLLLLGAVIKLSHTLQFYT